MLKLYIQFVFFFFLSSFLQASESRPENRHHHDHHDHHHTEEFLGSEELRLRIEVFLNKLADIESRNHFTAPRSYHFVTKEGRFYFQPNAVAEIIIEGIDIQVQTLEEFRSSLPKYEGLWHYLGLALEKMRESLHFVRHHPDRVWALSKKFGIRIEAEALKLYSDKGIVATIFVGATWPIYSFITEYIEHQILGPFGTLCMTSQMIYFAGINSIFNSMDNISVLLKYKGYFNYLTKAKLLSRWIGYELKLRKMYQKAYFGDSEKSQSKSQFKADFLTNFFSRIEFFMKNWFNDVFWANQNFKSKREFLNWVNLYSRAPFDLSNYGGRLEINSQIFTLLKTPLWAEILESIKKINTHEDFVMPERVFSQQIKNVYLNKEPIYQYAFLRESFLVFDVLSREINLYATSLNREDALLGFDFIWIKSMLGKMKRDIRLKKAELMLMSLDDSVPRYEVATQLNRDFSTFVDMYKNSMRIIGNASSCSHLFLPQ